MVMHKIDQAVCPEAKVFVGQVPLETTEEEITQLFSQYGSIKSCVIMTGQDGRSRGAAMVLYERWSEAERAIEAENLTSSLGGTKPLVVRIADPPKGNGPGICPKKLFVGQIPVTMSDAEMHNLFAPFGNVVEIALLKKNPGAACAFVTYERWAHCEAAIEALNGKTHLEGAKCPMVVKFADAKVDGFGGGMMNPKRPFLSNTELQGVHNNTKKQFHGMGGGFNAYGGFDINAMAAMQAHMGSMAYNMGGMTIAHMPGMIGMSAVGMPMNNGMNRNSGAMMQSNRMGSGTSDESAKQWKLFVGQVPFVASEQDLWPVFSEIGNIIELVILRNPMGQSKGCAFITYESRMQADKAIQQIDGKVYLPNDPKQRVLIVKYASPGSGHGGGGSGSMASGSTGHGINQNRGGMMNGMPTMMVRGMNADTNSMMAMGGMMSGMGSMTMMPDQSAFSHQPIAAYSQQTGNMYNGYPGQF